MLHKLLAHPVRSFDALTREKVWSSFFKAATYELNDSIDSLYSGKDRPWKEYRHIIEKSYFSGKDISVDLISKELSKKVDIIFKKKNIIEWIRSTAEKNSSTGSLTADALVIAFNKILDSDLYVCDLSGLCLRGGPSGSPYEALRKGRIVKMIGMIGAQTSRTEKRKVNRIILQQIFPELLLNSRATLLRFLLESPNLFIRARNTFVSTEDRKSRGEEVKENPLRAEMNYLLELICTIPKERKPVYLNIPVSEAPDESLFGILMQDHPSVFQYAEFPGDKKYLSIRGRLLPKALLQVRACFSQESDRDIINSICTQVLLKKEVVPGFIFHNYFTGADGHTASEITLNSKEAEDFKRKHDLAGPIEVRAFCTRLFTEMVMERMVPVMKYYWGDAVPSRPVAGKEDEDLQLLMPF